MDEIEIEVHTDINPSEDETKVRRAVENLFGTMPFVVKPQTRGSTLSARAKGMEGLTKLQNLLRRERIRAAARAVLYAGKSDDVIVFYVNKQVAYAGHVSFSEATSESPLGPIRVEIRCDNARELIDWLAPRAT